MANALLLSPAIMLNVSGLPVVTKGVPTLAPFPEFSAMLLVWLLIVITFSIMLVILMTIVAVLALASSLVIFIVRV